MLAWCLDVLILDHTFLLYLAFVFFLVTVSLLQSMSAISLEFVCRAFRVFECLKHLTPLRIHMSLDTIDEILYCLIHQLSHCCSIMRQSNFYNYSTISNPVVANKCACVSVLMCLVLWTQTDSTPCPWFAHLFDWVKVPTLYSQWINSPSGSHAFHPENVLLEGYM